MERELALAIGQLPVALQDRTRRWFERLGEEDLQDLSPEVIAPLVRVIACSEFAAATLKREWPWFIAQQERLAAVPDPDALTRFADDLATSDSPTDEIKKRIRQYRHRYLLHVLWREITGVAALDETLAALSDLADRLLAAAERLAARRMLERYGVVRDESGEPVSIAILGMGKLGGRELNFSSDIDLVFLFPGGSDSDGDKSLSPQEYFTRVSQHIIALIDEVTEDGFAFRIDTRLRPFGDSGPPVVGFAALESYLLQHGRDWERYAYVKARLVGPQLPQSVTEELYGDLIEPFVYRRYLDYGVFQSLREMQAMIAAEVKRRDLADNIKLGPGGIREIEFVAQSLQLVRGGNRPELRSCELQSVLPELVGERGLSSTAARTLSDAYTFLRRLENFIQAIRDQQTHDLPQDDIDRERLCCAMGYPDWPSLLEALDAHRTAVSAVFDAVAFRAGAAAQDDSLGSRLGELWERSADAAAWGDALDREGFTDAADLASELERFQRACAAKRIDAAAGDRLQKFIPTLLVAIRSTHQPHIALRRSLSVIRNVLRRSAYLALLNENQLALARLVELCERSQYVAEELARYPVLLDELLDPRVFSSQLSRDEVAGELQVRMAHCSTDPEAQMEALAQFQRANLFRVAVADFGGNLPIMKVSDALTELAEIVLDYALSIAWDEMVGKYGRPGYVTDSVAHEAGFGIVGYGKLGGLELSYGSDLDVVFLHDSHGDEQHTDGDNALDNTRFFARLVRRLVHFLTTQTGSGVMYEIDMRLRPDGSSGLLVTSTEAFERYQEDNAWTWEHQALLRARPVAGSESIAAEFERIRGETLINRVRRESLRDDVVKMRDRMRRELDKSGEARFDIKQGRGGIADIEFLVQYLVLRFACNHGSVIHYSDNIRQLDALAETACIDRGVAARLQDIYRAYRLRVHHLVLDQHKAEVDAAEFAAEREFVNAIWSEHLDETAQD